MKSESTSKLYSICYMLPEDGSAMMLCSAAGSIAMIVYPTAFPHACIIQ